MKFWEHSWFWGLVGAAILLAVFGIFTVTGFPGEPDECVTEPDGNCYCEAYVSPEVDNTGVKQPSNTWSALAPILFGVIILYWADQERFRRAVGNNPMTTGSFYSIFFGALVIFLGPGSMFFHGSLTRWGGFIDSFSMVLFMTFLILYNIFRIFRWDEYKGWFVVLYAGIIVALAIPSYAVTSIPFGLIAFAALVVGEIIFEIVISASSPRGVARRWLPWLLLALITFAVAMALWVMGWTGSPFCNPNSAWQFHIPWHILAMGVTPFFIFLYLRSETRT